MNTGVHFFWTHLIDTPSLQSAWVVPECGTTWQAMPQDSHPAPGAACWGSRLSPRSVLLVACGTQRSPLATRTPKPLLNTEFHSVAARSCGTLFTCLRR